MGVETGKNIPYLDGWRGIAILFVLGGHFGPERFWWMGRTGVVLFFVLSGLFMGRILFIKKVELSSFFARRFIRIIPTMWLFLLAMYFYARYGQARPYTVPFSEFLSSMFFLSTYFPQDISIWKTQWANGHMWSLNVEEHSYMYLAFGAFIISKSRGVITATTFLIGTLALVMTTIALYMTGVLHEGASPWRTHTEVASLGLIASATIAVLRNNAREGAILRSAFIPLISIAIAFYMFRPGRFNLWNASIIAAPIFAAIAVNYAENFPGLIKNILSMAPLRWFGICSFSIYLWQAPFYSMVHNGFPKPVGLVLGIIVGAISFYFFENPVRVYLNNRWAQHKERQRSVIASVAI